MTLEEIQELLSRPVCEVLFEIAGIPYIGYVRGLKLDYKQLFWDRGHTENSVVVDVSVTTFCICTLNTPRAFRRIRVFCKPYYTKTTFAERVAGGFVEMQASLRELKVIAVNPKFRHGKFTP